MHRLLRWYREYCTSAAKKCKVEEVALQQWLEAAHRQLQHNTTCSATRDALAEASEALQEHTSWKLDGQLVRARVLWRHKGDRSTEEFYKAVNQKTPKTSITELFAKTLQRRLQPVLMEVISYD
jgi:hypothetical protein